MTRRECRFARIAAVIAIAAWGYPAAASDQTWAFVTNAYGGIKVPEWSVPAVGDLDADGDVDLVLGNGAGLSLYRNDGTATSPAWTLVSDAYLGHVTNQYPSPALGDLDADGDLDLVVFEIGSGTYHYRNDGTPQAPSFTLVTSTFVEVPQPGCSHVPTLVDLDADGDLDLFENSCDWISDYFENVGDAANPAFQLTVVDYVKVAVGLSGYGNYLAFEDIDLDGDLDMLASDSNTAPAFLRNVGTAAAPSWQLETTEYRQIYPVNGQWAYIFPVFVDIDADGMNEVLMGDLDGYLNFFENKHKK